MTSQLDSVRVDLRRLVVALRAAQVPPVLIESIRRKCLLTPRRQTGRVDRRTNREPRWNVAEDHPDYSTEMGARLVFLRLLLDLLRMSDAPRTDRGLVDELSIRLLGSPLSDDPLRDPVTDEVLSYSELIRDVVEKPKHGYSKFHIGHQDPQSHPKHDPENVRWQLKSSNDFQGTMDVRVARLAFRIDELARNPQARTLDEVREGLAQLCRDLGLPIDNG